MLNIILCGAPGSGKGTQSEFIVKKYGLDHLSTGDVLRAEIASGSELGKEIGDLIAKGNLVPDHKMIHLIEHYLDTRDENCKGIIFDGFPRTVDQAEALTLLLERKHMSAVMLDMFVEEDEIIKRLLNRGKTSGRADDNYETIKKRIQVFHEVTQPVCNYYLKRRNYFAINGNNTMENTFAQIDTILQLIQK
ncbi:MAG: adenylate kinase [Paludibacteraceae bacterium]|nr:adenylate kinase [Candidatus Colicola coprequi]MCQ2333973.1 adenylate kinase [Paludibacteraceae bacterium]